MSVFFRARNSIHKIFHFTISEYTDGVKTIRRSCKNSLRSVIFYIFCVVYNALISGCILTKRHTSCYTEKRYPRSSQRDPFSLARVILWKCNEEVSGRGAEKKTITWRTRVGRWSHARDSTASSGTQVDYSNVVNCIPWARMLPLEFSLSFPLSPSWSRVACIILHVIGWKTRKQICSQRATWRSRLQLTLNCYIDLEFIKLSRGPPLIVEFEVE